MTDEIEVCRNGHPRTAENTMYERLPNGKLRRRCRVCRQLRANKNRESVASQPIVGGVILTERNLSEKEVEALPDTDKAVLEKFEKALKFFGSKCQGNPARYSDYGQEDVNDIPSPYLAAGMCNGCQVAKLCHRSAEIEKPAWGVRDGEVWAYGNRITHGERNTW